MARPTLNLDENKIVELASKGATVKYIAAFLDVSEDVLYRRYQSAMDRGRSLRDGCLQMRQYEAAMSGSGLMLKWLGQQWLGQSDKVEHHNSGDSFALDSNSGTVNIPSRPVLQ